MKHSEVFKMKKWLNKVIKLQKKLSDIQDFDDELQICTGCIGQSVHIHVGIERLAEAVGEKVITVDNNHEQFPIRKYFIYKNTEVFQIGTKEGK